MLFISEAAAWQCASILSGVFFLLEQRGEARQCDEIDCAHTLDANHAVVVRRGEALLERRGEARQCDEIVRDVRLRTRLRCEAKGVRAAAVRDVRLHAGLRCEAKGEEVAAVRDVRLHARLRCEAKGEKAAAVRDVQLHA